MYEVVSCGSRNAVIYIGIDPGLSGAVVGQTFGKWTVKKLGIRKDSHETYLCVCSCGNEQNVRTDQLVKGMSTGCRACGSKGPNLKARISVSGVCRKGHCIAAVGISPGGMCRLCRWECYIKNTYGLTSEEYLDIYKIQNGKCGICSGPLALPLAFGVAGSKEYEKRTEIDHKHVPKKVKPQPEKRDLVRGLLCGGRYAGCNAKLGHVDNVEWLRAAADYLSDPPAQRRLRSGK